jgi:hypothetical protein
MANQPVPNPAHPGMILPGDRGLLLGQKAIPGFQGTGGNNLSVDNAGVLTAGQNSRSIAIAARPGDHPSTQRQLIWRVRLITGTAGLDLQVSIDPLSDWTTIDTYSGTADSVRVIGAERGAAASNLPAALSAAAILSSARFVRVLDTGSGTTAFVDVVCQ